MINKVTYLTLVSLELAPFSFKDLNLCFMIFIHKKLALFYCTYLLEVKFHSRLETEMIDRLEITYTIFEWSMYL